MTEQVPRPDNPIVFVIDDDPSMRSALDSLIRSVALNVRCFATTEEFLRTKGLKDRPVSSWT